MKYTTKVKKPRMFNKYYVVDDSESNILGTNPTKKELSTSKILYEGTNPKVANQVHKSYNSGKTKFAHDHAVIYSAVDNTDRTRLHKY